MPYIDNARREPLVKNYMDVKSYGELNYVITQFLLQAWKQSPRYDTIHVLRRNFVTDPKNCEFLNHLKDVFAHNCNVADIYTGAAEAFLEFRLRVGAEYEANKIAQNGDLPEYEAALAALNEPEPAVEPVAVEPVVDSPVQGAK